MLPLCDGSCKWYMRLKRVWYARCAVFKCGMAGCAAGLLVGVSVPREYSVVAKMAPEGLRYRAGSGVIEFARMEGLNIHEKDRLDGISFDLFPEVVASAPFLLGLQRVAVFPSATALPVSLRTYLSEKRETPWWRVPFAVFRKLTAWCWRPEDAIVAGEAEYLHELRSRLEVRVDGKSGLISVSVRMRDAAVAACVADSVLAGLSRYVTDYRTGRARARLETTERLYRQAGTEYYEMSFRCAAFRDRHRNPATRRVEAEAERLDHEAEIAKTAYANLSLYVNQLRISLQQQTPCYTVIEPPLAANARVSPRLLLLASGIALAFATVRALLLLFGIPVRKSPRRLT